jgi:hypothetical protein
MARTQTLGNRFSPLYFLAALGNGGMAITFFIYLMFLVPHPETPIPTFESVQPFFAFGNPLASAGVLLAMGGMLVFAFRHFRALLWNLRQYSQFKQTTAYTSLRQSNAEVGLLAIPLTLAMSVNVLFVLGAVFAPGLWSVVEYLFPLSLLAFASIGFYALRIYSAFFTRILTSGFDCERNNNLSQMTAVFAFAMVGVGFAASAAMSHTLTTVAVAMFGSIFFISAAILLGLISLVLGFRAMLQHGVDQETSVSLWVIIPILTLIGITFIRLSHGLHSSFDVHTGPAGNFVLTSAFLSIQLLFGGLGYAVMKRVNYYQDFVSGERKSPGSYALICPGVALFVFGMFFIHAGLLKNGVITAFSLPHLLLMAPLVYLQVRTILVMLRLDRKLLRTEPEAATPAPTAA